MLHSLKTSTGLSEKGVAKVCLSILFPILPFLLLSASVAHPQIQNRGIEGPKTSLGSSGIHSEAEVLEGLPTNLLRLCERSYEMLESRASRLRIYLHWLSLGH